MSGGQSLSVSIVLSLFLSLSFFLSLSLSLSAPIVGALWVERDTIRRWLPATCRTVLLPSRRLRLFYSVLENTINRLFTPAQRINSTTTSHSRAVTSLLRITYITINFPCNLYRGSAPNPAWRFPSQPLVTSIRRRSSALEQFTINFTLFRHRTRRIYTSVVENLLILGSWNGDALMAAFLVCRV